MLNDQTGGTPYEWFSNAFFEALVGAMTEATGTPWTVSADDSMANEPEPVRIRLAVSGGLAGEFQIEFGAEAANSLRVPAAELPQALLKLAEAAIGQFCSALAPQYGLVTIEAAPASEAMADAGHVAEYSASSGSDSRLPVRVMLPTGLVEGLRLQARAADEKTIPAQVNLDLVMDVELNVTLRFGQRQLTLREVLDLTSGSVIELDRQVEEPVELLLEGKVIARGEAVVIDGNYGLRVTEVPRPISSLSR